MSSLPREARDGITRAWLEILRERHPGMTWLPLEDGSLNNDENTTAASDAQEVEGVVLTTS